MAKNPKILKLGISKTNIDWKNNDKKTLNPLWNEKLRLVSKIVHKPGIEIFSGQKPITQTTS